MAHDGASLNALRKRDVLHNTPNVLEDKDYDVESIGSKTKFRLRYDFQSPQSPTSEKSCLHSRRDLDNIRSKLQQNLTEREYVAVLALMKIRPPQQLFAALLRQMPLLSELPLRARQLTTLKPIKQSTSTFLSKFWREVGKILESEQ
ncbi:hypothetical protein CC78DRAFT_574893 [Lojkania enalia]|uniref:Uncharacterized protein n=1 Tax=Lojkania enalia TaxID=147567 RepID=A0A9P4TNA6_9PLEO|nr:hypothetical protein CC78DRAFT_574893 [Didymosphaeria enalia]